MVDDPEVVSAGDPLIDALFFQYVPSVPSVGKWRSTAVLAQSLASADPTGDVTGMVATLRGELEPGRTVWCARFGAQRASWEFHWFTRAFHGSLPIGTIERCLGQLAFSELARTLSSSASGLSIELGDVEPGTPGVSGIRMMFSEAEGVDRPVLRYDVSGAAPSVSEVLMRYVREPAGAEMRARVASSPHAVAAPPPEDDIWRLFGEATLATVGYGSDADTVYVIGLPIDAFVAFVDGADVPASFRDWLQSNRSMLDHLRFDVSLTYSVASSSLSWGIMGVF